MTTFTRPAQVKDLAEFVEWRIVRRVYGLPCAWIQALGEPDIITPHPYDPLRYRLFYSRQRVEDFIDSRREEYLNMLIARARESRQNDLCLCRQANALIAWARTVEITLQPLPASMANLKLETQRFFKINGDDFRMTDRAIVAHIRHGRTNYHELLSRLRSRMPGATTAYLIIRRRANALIRRQMDQHYQQRPSGADHE